MMTTLVDNNFLGIKLINTPFDITKKLVAFHGRFITLCNKEALPDDLTLWNKIKLVAKAALAYLGLTIFAILSVPSELAAMKDRNKTEQAIKLLNQTCEELISRSFEYKTDSIYYLEINLNQNDKKFKTNMNPFNLISEGSFDNKGYVLENLNVIKEKFKDDFINPTYLSEESKLEVKMISVKKDGTGYQHLNRTCSNFMKSGNYYSQSEGGYDSAEDANFEIIKANITAVFTPDIIALFEPLLKLPSN